MPGWLLRKGARIDGSTIMEQDGLYYYIKDHQQGLFAHAAPNNTRQGSDGR